MKKWELEIYSKYFDLIKSGKKTVKGRAPSRSKDYGQMRPDDNLTFTNLDTGKRATVTIAKVIHYPTVEQI